MSRPRIYYCELLRTRASLYSARVVVCLRAHALAARRAPQAPLPRRELHRGQARLRPPLPALRSPPLRCPPPPRPTQSSHTTQEHARASGGSARPHLRDRRARRAGAISFEAFRGAVRRDAKMAPVSRQPARRPPSRIAPRHRDEPRPTRACCVWLPPLLAPVDADADAGCIASSALRAGRDDGSAAQASVPPHGRLGRRLADARPNQTASLSLRRPLLTPSANAQWLHRGAKRS